MITGTIVTVDDARPTDEALAVGDRSDVAGFIGNVRATFLAGRRVYQR